MPESEKDKADKSQVLNRLFEIIESRKTASPDESYTARMFAKGPQKLAQKLGEEAVEAVIATVEKDNEALIDESADLLYHLLLVWSERGVQPADVLGELESRMATSGLAAKASPKRDDVRGQNK